MISLALCFLFFYAVAIPCLNLFLARSMPKHQHFYWQRSKYANHTRYLVAIGDLHLTWTIVHSIQ